MTASTLNYPRALIGFMLLKDRIADAIKTSEKSQADIARACGVTDASVVHWLNGTTVSLKAETLLHLEEATGCRAAWIMWGRGSKRLGDPFWPFGSIEIARFRALPEKEQGIVEAKLDAAIDESARRVQTLSRALGPAVSDAQVEKHLPALPPGAAEMARLDALNKRAKPKKTLQRKRG